MKIPIRYLPTVLSKKDRKKQLHMLQKSRKAYRKGKFINRKPISSFHSKKSNHIQNAIKMYKIKNILPNKKLASVTGCSIPTLKKIVNKGKGAYFSSGSRPNQTAQSWGLARLASSVTGGKASIVDFKLLENGCKHSGKAYKLAVKTKKKYGNNNSKYWSAKKTKI